MNTAQQCYPTQEKELLAIVCVLAKWKVDLLGTEFIVFTNHHTQKLQHPKRPLTPAVLVEFLVMYNFDIKYVKGEDNTVTDILSHAKLP